MKCKFNTFQDHLPLYSALRFRVQKKREAWNYCWEISPRRSRWPRILRSGFAGTDCWYFGFESRREHWSLSLVIVVFCQVEVSSSGRSVVRRCSTECLDMIVKPHQWAGLGPLGLSSHEKKKYFFFFSVSHGRSVRPSLMKEEVQMGPIGCPETSVRNYHYSVHKSPKERSSLCRDKFAHCW